MYDVRERDLLQTAIQLYSNLLDLIKVCEQLTRDKFLILAQSLLLFEYNSSVLKNAVCDFA